jgi:hypothetical protein
MFCCRKLGVKERCRSLRHFIPTSRGGLRVAHHPRQSSINLATDPAKVEVLTETLGVPAVRLAHQWASANVESGFGVDITWRRDDLIKAEVRLQPQEIAHLANIIRSTTAKEEVTITGELTHVDTQQKTFRMSVIDPLNRNVRDKEIYGAFDKAITSAHPARLPRVYRATLNVLQRVVVQDGQEETTYFLVRLDDPAAPPLLSGLESR